MGELYTLQEVAALARQSRRTIERRVADGTLPVVRPGGARTVRVTQEALRAYLAGPVRDRRTATVG